MPTRPDLTNRSSWVRLFEHGAKAEGSTPLEHPPQYGFDEDDPAIKAWELVRTGTAATRLLDLEGMSPDEASIGPMLRPRDDLAIEVIEGRKVAARDGGGNRYQRHRRSRRGRGR